MVRGYDEGDEMAQVNLAAALREIQEQNIQVMNGSLLVLDTHELGSEVNSRIGKTLIEAAQSKKQITIRMPTELVGITPSFLKAMFGKSLNEIKSPEEFRRVFHIDASIEVSVQIVRALEAILMARRHGNHSGFGQI